MNEKRLAELIEQKIKESFQNKHISGNLMNTIKVYKTKDGWAIDIPAEAYDIKQYNKKGVIVHTGKGSYAQSVDKSGGFSHTHKNYVEKAIAEAISIWMKENRVNGKVKES